MTSTRRRTATLLAISATVLAAMALPSAASALVYCVGVTGGDCDFESPDPEVMTPQSALDAASGNPGPDRVRLGPTTYATASSGGFSYNGADPVELVGSGIGATTLTTTAADPTNLIVSNTGPNGSSLSDLSVVLPTPGAGLSYYGISAGNGSYNVARVRVHSAQPFNGFGALLQGGGTMDEVDIDLPIGGSTGTPGLQFYSPLTVTDSSISSDVAVLAGASGAALTMRSSSLTGHFTGIDLQSGSIDVSSSLIDAAGTGISIGNPNGGMAAESITAALDGVTIVTHGALLSTGVHAFTNFTTDPLPPAMADNHTVNIRNSILDQDIDIAIQREADDNGTANVTTAFSNLDPMSNVSTNTPDGDAADAGMGAIIPQGGDMNVVSGFVSPGGPNPDYHLLPSSPLIDIGDPAAPAAGSIDVDGQSRALDGSFNCTFVQRRDVGADEFAGANQGTPASCNPAQTTTTENAECEPLRQKIKRLTRKIKQAADDPPRRATLKRKRRNARNRLAALGCTP